MSDVYILSACRTPIGKFQGKLRDLSASDLGSFVITEALKRARLAPGDVDEVILGQALSAGQGQNPARQASVAAKIPYEVPAFTVNMLCGSGLKAVILAYQAIKSGSAKVVVAGGQESMTRAQHCVFLRGNNVRMGSVALADTMLTDGLTDAFHNIHMGNTAEHLAETYGIDREQQDEYALQSQKKTENAIKNGYFSNEIVTLHSKDGQPIDVDEFPRIGCTKDELSSLKPAFVRNTGTVTAGNASGVNDGAAALLICNSDFVKIGALLGARVLARIVAVAQCGLEPIKMGLGPIEAVKLVIKNAEWDLKTVDLFELNEAFAVQSIIVLRELGVDKDKVNVNGGAIALGHPIGASGARVLVTLLYNLIRLNKKRGVAALCIGGGMGIAIAVETV